MKKIPMGYQALTNQLKLKTLPHHRTSFVKLSGQPVTKLNNRHEIHEYLKSYAIENPEDPFAQLEFALKYDGVNLEILNVSNQSKNVPSVTKMKISPFLKNITCCLLPMNCGREAQECG
jgi:hypothetical protein